MFNNLIAEMARNKITNEKIAVAIERNPNTVSQKMLGKVEFTRKEMWTIKEKFFPDLSIDYLFDC